MSAAEPTTRAPGSPGAGAVAAPGAGHGWSGTGRFFRSELRLIFGRRRNQAGMAVLAAFPVIIAIATRIDPPTGGGGEADFFASITGNGFFVALAALSVEIGLFLPVAVAAIAGDSVAGEANLGTLRYLLTVPVSRNRLLAVKYAAIVVFALAVTLLVAVVGLVAGLVLFGGGPVTLLSGNQVGFGEGLLRLLAVCGYLTVGLSALGALGLFVSTLTEQPMGAIIANTILVVASQVLNAIPQLDWLHPYLLTHYWLNFAELLRDPVAFEALRPGLLSAAAYIVIFISAAWARFAGRDVTS
ncbi:ABC transporter permease [Micromonospora sp. HM5-17]|uniref:ABC transporter permease n=1 Tax=Micromonospora sp. HM5-17 TaxID=2487710 RepID=UPI000F47BF2B|nr:ABC transporter permease [Micromonospora sp. HM5-17]ROT33123.1 ABC transporter permease [Micromonospora sp. HM5-17]